MKDILLINNSLYLTQYDLFIFFEHTYWVLWVLWVLKKGEETVGGVHKLYPSPSHHMAKLDSWTLHSNAHAVPMYRMGWIAWHDKYAHGNILFFPHCDYYSNSTPHVNPRVQETISKLWQSPRKFCTQCNSTWTFLIESFRMLSSWNLYIKLRKFISYASTVKGTW